jgi:protein SCO1/2
MNTNAFRAPTRHLALAALLLALLVVLTACGGGGNGSGSTNASAQTIASVPGGDAVPARPAPPIELTDYRGHRVDLAQLKGKPVLVAFLYTHCHDLCPLVAADVHTAYSLLKPGAEKPVFLAVSVDPAHDTPASAVKFNQEHLTSGEIDWLLGSQTELKRVWNAWSIVPKRKANDPEVIEHSAELFGIDRQGNIRVLFPVNVRPPALAKGMERLAGL